jgi:PAS domain S-box-containing protein
MSSPALSLDPSLLPAVLETVATPVVVLDLEARIRLFNSAAERSSGYDRKDVLERPVWFLLDEADRARARVLFDELMDGAREDLLGSEIAWITRSGERRDLSWSTSTLKEESGTARLLVCTAVDLTEIRSLRDRTDRLVAAQAVRRAREEALRSSEARFSGIVELASDAIVSINQDHEILLFNKGAERIFGWTAGEILGKHLDVLLPEDVRERHRKDVAEFGRSAARSRKMGERRGIYGRRRSGEAFPAEASILKLDVDGVRIYTVVLRDVSEQRRAELHQWFLVEVGKVLASSLDLDTTLSAIADMAVTFLADYCVVDLLEESGGVRRIRVSVREGMNEDAARILGEVELDRSRPHLMSSVLESGQPELVPDVTPHRLEALAQSEEHLAGLRALDARSYMVVPLVSRERMVGTLLLVSSTGRNAYDAEDLELATEVGVRAGIAVENARLYRDAQRAIQARDDLLGVVSHDLGNPLQAIFIGLEALEKAQASGEPDPERAAYYLSAIRRSADLMQRLIHDLLEVRRMEEGHLPLERGSHRLPELVDQALDLIEPLARVKSVVLENHLAAMELPSVEVDPDRIQQVLSNLVGNAVKHTPHEGRVTVQATVFEGEMRISVTDTGPGIPEEHREQVFDRFWRAEKTGGKGIGLGLPIARGIVRSHGGRIWVESAPGDGSTFHFTLPLASEHPGA